MAMEPTQRGTCCSAGPFTWRPSLARRRERSLKHSVPRSNSNSNPKSTPPMESYQRGQRVLHQAELEPSNKTQGWYLEVEVELERALQLTPSHEPKPSSKKSAHALIYIDPQHNPPKKKRTQTRYSTRGPGGSRAPSERATKEKNQGNVRHACRNTPPHKGAPRRT